MNSVRLTLQTAKFQQFQKMRLLEHKCSGAMTGLQRQPRMSHQSGARQPEQGNSKITRSTCPSLHVTCKGFSARESRFQGPGSRNRLTTRRSHPGDQDLNNQKFDHPVISLLLSKGQVCRDKPLHSRSRLRGSSPAVLKWRPVQALGRRLFGPRRWTPSCASGLDWYY